MNEHDECALCEMDGGAAGCIQDGESFLGTPAGQTKFA
jgi:hypothetical protein